MVKINQLSLIQNLMVNVLVIGQEKGENLIQEFKETLEWWDLRDIENYPFNGVSDRFNIPIISFIDTPGAYPGVGATEDK